VEKQACEDGAADEEARAAQGDVAVPSPIQDPTLYPFRPW